MRLITNEDPFHIHKIFGIYCFCNLLYQTFMFLLYSKMNLTIPIMIPHLLLPATLLVFKVLAKRPKSKAIKMFILKELQIFELSASALFCILFPKLCIFQQIFFVVVFGYDSLCSTN